MSMINIPSGGLTKAQRLEMYRRPENTELSASLESFTKCFENLVDIKRHPFELYNPEMRDLAVRAAMEMVDNSGGLQKYSNAVYEEGAHVFLEGVGAEDAELDADGNLDPEDDVSEAVTMEDLHRGNLQRLMENSFAEGRAAQANQRDLGELMPFDAFLPFAIIRTYLPLVGKDLVPYIVPKQHFIRIKEQFKYIVTKDNRRYLEPDVYRDLEAATEILKTAKGNEVTATWYPEDMATDVTDAVKAEDDATEKLKLYDYDEDTGTETKYFKINASKEMRVVDLDLLAESGGNRDIGDALDINVAIDAARALVTNSEGVTYMVEVSGLEMFIDTTAISPKEQIGGVVRYPVKDSTGKIERWVEDKIMATYDPYTSRINVVSMSGLTKQVKFAGNLSNKNNMEYMSFHDSYQVKQHPIPEGYRQNMPITVEDMRLYNETASIDIIAYGINRMTEIFNGLEDTDIINFLRQSSNKFRGVTEHDFLHFKGRVFVTRTVDVKYEQNNPFMKRLDFMQDKISNELNAIIREMRNTCQNEPFRLVAYCHPNIASLFVGTNVDWKINDGDSIMGSIRSDYNMGIITQDGNMIRIITSLKFPQEDGLRGLVFPINEQNFLTWKHFKRALYFDRDHRIVNMPNNPNIMCVATFSNKYYVPLSWQLKIKNYDNAVLDEEPMGTATGRNYPYIPADNSGNP